MTADRPEPTGAGRSCLVGFTGFVGSNLSRVYRFDSLVNRANHAETRGASFDLVVCAAAPAEKWRANRDPETDRAAIDSLLGHLATLEARRFVLISTIDVYPTPTGVDETSAISREACHPYGRHRLYLEQEVARRFSDHLIVRLPALFGPGLKKNALYDLLHDNNVDAIDPQAQFQFFDVRRTWEIVEAASSRGIRALNVATPPIAMGQIASSLFHRTLRPRDGAHPAYDVRTIHGEGWGRTDGYLLDRQASLAAVASFVESVRGAAS